MSRKETKGLTGGFIPPELKKNENWQGSFDREESLSDPRWHNRPPRRERRESPNSQDRHNSRYMTHLQQHPYGKPEKCYRSRTGLRQTQNQLFQKSSSRTLIHRKTHQANSYKKRPQRQRRHKQNHRI